MGKKNKNRNAESTTELDTTEIRDTTEIIEEKSIIIDTKKRKKEKNKSKTIQEDSNIAIENHKKNKFNDDSGLHDVSSTGNINKKRKNQDTEKPKKIKCGDDGESEEVSPENVSTNKKNKQKHNIENPKKNKFGDDDEHEEVPPEKVSTNKKIKQKHNTENPKKIKFGDDGEPEEVSLENVSTNKKVNKDKRSYLNAEEQDVKDEDIDQFCDDVDEEENKQYESWITLLEQKLGSSQSKVENKNKKKNKK